MALPLAIPAIVGVGAWAARLTGAVQLGSVLFAIIKLYWFVSLVSVAFWIACVFFAKEIFIWICQVISSLVDLALSAAGVENPGPKIVQLVNLMPDVVLDLWARLGVWEGIGAILAAYAMNMALRCIPLIGGIFRG